MLLRNGNGALCELLIRRTRGGGGGDGFGVLLVLVLLLRILGRVFGGVNDTWA